MNGIGKTFPGVRALNHVDFFLRRGEIHALMGENGAGKSTLIKVLTGVFSMDEGTVRLDGHPLVIHSPQDAQRHGISTVVSRGESVSESHRRGKPIPGTRAAFHGLDRLEADEPPGCGIIAETQYISRSISAVG